MTRPASSTANASSIPSVVRIRRGRGAVSRVPFPAFRTLEATLCASSDRHGPSLSPDAGTTSRANPPPPCVWAARGPAESCKVVAPRGCLLGAGHWGRGRGRRNPRSVEGAIERDRNCGIAVRRRLPHANSCAMLLRCAASLCPRGLPRPHGPSSAAPPQSSPYPPPSSQKTAAPRRAKGPGGHRRCAAQPAAAPAARRRAAAPRRPRTRARAAGVPRWPSSSSSSGGPPPPRRSSSSPEKGKSKAGPRRSSSSPDFLLPSPLTRRAKLLYLRGAGQEATPRACRAGRWPSTLDAAPTQGPKDPRRTRLLPDPRKTPPRWTSLEPTNVATVFFLPWFATKRSTWAKRKDGSSTGGPPSHMTHDKSPCALRWVARSVTRACMAHDDSQLGSQPSSSSSLKPQASSFKLPALGRAERRLGAPAWDRSGLEYGPMHARCKIGLAEPNW